MTEVAFGGLCPLSSQGSVTGFWMGCRPDVGGAISAPAPLVCVLSGGLSLSGPGSPSEGEGACQQHGRPWADPGMPQGPGRDGFQLALLRTHPPPASVRLAAPPRAHPGLAEGGSCTGSHEGPGPPLSSLSGGGPLISAAPPRGSLSPLSRVRARTKPFCAWLSGQRKCLGLVKKNVSIRTKSQVGTRK